MTEHTFPSAPNEVHNHFEHYFCTTCDGAKLVPTSVPCVVGPYGVRVDAVAFPTCEAVRDEQARLATRDEVSRRERTEANAKYAVQLAEFQAKYPRGGYYWVRFPAEARAEIAKLDAERTRWTIFGDDADPATGDYRRVTSVEVIAGPIEPPVPTGSLP